MTGSNAWLNAATGSSTGYSVTTTSVPTGNTFTILNTAGVITRSCTIAGTNAGGCQRTGATNAGTW